MPFPQQRARPFIRAQVDALSEGRYGVYGLVSEAGEYIYIGSGDIHAHLLAHLDGILACVTERQPTSFVEWLPEVDVSATTITALPNLEKRQQELIEEYSPPCND